jgi:hypothetical protein
VTSSVTELTPQRLHAGLLETSLEDSPREKKTEPARGRAQDEDIVHAPWRHGEPREQGSRTGRCGWITSFLRSFKKFLVEATDRTCSRGHDLAHCSALKERKAARGPPL